MNKFLIPLLILLWSLTYCWFWNCERGPYCDSGNYDINAVVAPAVVEVTEMDAMAATEPVEMTEKEEEELLFIPLDVYFQAANAGIERSSEINNFIEIARKYLEARPDKSLSLVGHTDNDGTPITNNGLSINRANKVRDMLVSDGFNTMQLITSGMGEDSPIASNETTEGRAKNRRVTIRLAE
ncbi:MAG: outer membrane protein OmpA-like peptidoglycan-associated protein [Algoriphagus sp.]|jgi:outer membrane protein OmpA-like peptidoglycan-associated protein